MQQIQELFEILKETPQMALWGLAIWCLFILGKLASIVYAIKVICQLAITKTHDYKIRKIEVEKLKHEQKIEVAKITYEKERLETEKRMFNHQKEFADVKKLSKRFDKAKISDVEMDRFVKLIDVIKGSGHYIHENDLEKAIKVLSKSK